MNPKDRQSVNALLLHLHAYGATPTQLVEVEQTITKAMTAGIPWLQILMTIGSAVLGMFMGTPLNIPALIAAIQALINPPAPTPVAK